MSSTRRPLLGLLTKWTETAISKIILGVMSGPLQHNLWSIGKSQLLFMLKGAPKTDLEVSCGHLWPSSHFTQKKM